MTPEQKQIETDALIRRAGVYAQTRLGHHLTVRTGKNSFMHGTIKEAKVEGVRSGRGYMEAVFSVLLEGPNGTVSGPFKVAKI